MFIDEELRQYSRQIRLPEIGLYGQEKLKNAKVLMIGAGGLGCPVLQYLVGAGVGKIGIVDDDHVDISNLHRQVLFTVHDVGSPKATTSKQRLELLNPHVEIIAYPLRFSAEHAQNLCAGYDLLIDGSDNFETRYLVNETAVALGKPLVFGSIFKFEGQVSVFNYQGGPNYRDLFPEPPLSAEVPNCAEIGVLGVLPGIIGSYMANEAIKIICGIGEVLSGQLLVINTLDNTTDIYKFSRQNTESRTKDQAASRPMKIVDQEITREHLDKWLTETPEDICVIDVREAYEFEEYNIGGINIPLYNLRSHLDDLPLDKKLVFCCQTGQRSQMAIQLLKPLVRADMYNLKNGINQA
jgi:molybdopterin/thiamine biosynthesis adenylyltransferase/rhodanese-related sulfurtransferase